MRSLCELKIKNVAQIGEVWVGGYCLWKGSR